MKIIRAVTILVSIIGAGINVVACGLGGDFSTPLLIALGAVFMALGAAPFAVSFLAAWRARLPLWGDVLMMTAAMACLAFSLYAYVSFVYRTSFDAQDGLIFLIVPVYQFVGLIAARAIARFSHM